MRKDSTSRYIRRQAQPRQSGLSDNPAMAAKDDLELTRRRFIACGITGAAALVLAPRVLAADPPRAVSRVETDDWPMYNHDLAGWRFNSAEKTLSPANVGNLVEKWRFPAADSKEPIGVVHATPAVVGGEVYFGTATFAAFYKLAADGTLRWVYRNAARKVLLQVHFVPSSSC
jgi:glucose dehydrogenase